MSKLMSSIGFVFYFFHWLVECFFSRMLSVGNEDGVLCRVGLVRCS